MSDCAGIAEVAVVLSVKVEGVITLCMDEPTDHWSGDNIKRMALGQLVHQTKSDLDLIEIQLLEVRGQL